jgi:purine-cytosine permease-like protein
MIITRYAGGMIGSRIFSALNILTQLGFSIIGVVLGGILLNALNPNLPLAVGVVVVSLVILVICCM